MKTKTQNKKVYMPTRRGYSLIELLVVLVIVAIMTAVMFNIVKGNRAIQDVEAASRQVAAQLRALQNGAITGQQISDGAGNMVTACQFIFSSSNGDTGYQVTYKDCAAGNVIKTQTYKLEKNGRVTIVNALNFTFQSPQGNTSAGTVTLNEGSRFNKICVSAGGGIDEKC